MKKIFLCLLALLLLAGMSFAQGYTSIQTNGPIQLFTNKTTTGVSAEVPDIGQSSHWLLYCRGGAAGTVTLQIEGSNDGTNYAPISDVATPTVNGCLVLEAAGYFPHVHANITSNTGGTTMNAWYSSSGGPVAGHFAPPKALLWAAFPIPLVSGATSGAYTEKNTTYLAFHSLVVQPKTGSVNQEQVSAANTAQTITLPTALTVFGTVYPVLYSFNVRCSAGTAGITVADSVGNLWSSAAWK